MGKKSRSASASSSTPGSKQLPVQEAEGHLEICITVDQGRLFKQLANGLDVTDLMLFHMGFIYTVYKTSDLIKEACRRKSWPCMYNPLLFNKGWTVVATSVEAFVQELKQVTKAWCKKVKSTTVTMKTHSEIKHEKHVYSTINDCLQAILIANENSESVKSSTDEMEDTRYGSTSDSDDESDSPAARKPVSKPSPTSTVFAKFSLDSEESEDDKEKDKARKRKEGLATHKLSAMNSKTKKAQKEEKEEEEKEEEEEVEEMEPIDPNPLDSEGEDWAKKHMKEKKAKGNEWVHQQQQTKPKKSAPHKSKQRHATQLEVMAEMSERSEEDIVESDDSINKFIIDDEEDTPKAFKRLSKSAKKQRSRREAILEEMKIGQDKRHAKNADAKVNSWLLHPCLITTRLTLL